MNPKTTHVNRRAMLLSSSVGALGVLVGSASPAQAATRPATHWGTFTKQDTRDFCQKAASTSLSILGYTLLASDNYLTIGDNTQVIVSVTSIPIDAQTTYMIVIASSDDYNVAAQSRNDVRAYIQSLTCNGQSDCGISVSF